MHNTQTIEYNRQINQRLLSVCSPLFEGLGLSFFAYKKLIKGKGIVYVSTNLEWVSYRAKANNWESDTFKEESKKLIRGTPHYCTWQHDANQPSDLYEELCAHGICRGVNRYLLSDQSLEVMRFAGTHSDRFNDAFYLQNSGVIEQFVTYFKKECLDIISKATIHNVHQSIWDEPHANDNAPLIPEAACSKFIMGSDGNVVKLTPRESDIAYHLAAGRTAKEIAVRLNISSRTIESYINNIKLKTGFHFKSELVEALNKAL